MSIIPLPYRVPLEGMVLIEASAGTGKTYTLERLIARHILWHGHAIDEVLAVTFTNAAATDIKLRLRAFLKRCLDYDGVSADGDIELLFGGRPPAVSESLLRSRLAHALADFDRAAVYTIHGFCQRLLQDYALECAQPIPASALLEDESALRLQVCEEFWRQYGQHPEFGDCLDAALGSPSHLVKSLAELLSTAELKPDKPVLLKPSLEEAFERLNTCFRSQHQHAFAALELAFSLDALHKTDFKSIEDIEKRFAELDAFLTQPNLATPARFLKLSFSGIREKKNKVKPDNPLFRQLDDWNAVVDDSEDYRRKCRIFLYHELRKFARARLSELKSQRNVIGFDDIIDAVQHALVSDAGDHLVRKIRNAYPVALVDEFQDTDERQWQIFERLYRRGGPASLTLIGDPKQAIYGFRGGDIHTYLKVQALADHRETLSHNFRSNQALLDGIASVFQAQHAQPFAEPGIAFIPVKAGRPGETLVVDDRIPPPLSFFGPGCQQLVGVTEARHACAHQCADAITKLLNQGQAGRAVVQCGKGDRPLLAGDIAVLVSRHSEAALMQNQLIQRGVAAVCASRENLFEAYEALDILQVLHAVRRPGSEHALASACGGLLIRSAMSDTTGRPDWQEMAQRLANEGPLAAFSNLLDAAYKPLLERPDGERHLANYLHVLELMQSEFTSARSPWHYLDWIGRRISLVQSTGVADAAHPRLESSNPRVKIMTLHQSKGLEFGLVFMPFTAIRASNKSEFARYFDGRQRCLHLDAKHVDTETKMLIDAEQASENLRLLYVGMTRAKFGLRCGWGLLKDLAKSSLGYLLLADQTADSGRCAEAVSGFPYAFESNRIEALPEAFTTEPIVSIPAFRGKPVPWQISSFSSLHRTQDTLSFRPADDEVSILSIAESSPFKGADFGNALHTVLEHAEALDWPAGRASAAALQHCQQALIDFGYPADMAGQGAPILADLAGNTLLAPLPEGPCLRDLPATEKRHELEFHLKLEQVDTAEILSALHRNGYCRGRDRFSFNQRLNGLLTGKIDLLYRHAGKVYIVDYKSNTLPDYGPEALQQSIKDQEYDLQYLLYTVAVHRWLRFCIPDYDYDRYFGGVRYLYARGLNPALPGNGIYCDRPSDDLILELDWCFSRRNQNDD